MKKLIFLFLYVFSLSLSAQYKEAVFNFNPKKYIKNNLANIKSSKQFSLNIIDINGQKTVYKMVDQSQPGLKEQGIYTLRGNSMDGKKRISVSLTKNSFTGIILEGPTSYYIEPIEKSCTKKYRIYTGARGVEKIGQENDYIK